MSTDSTPQTQHEVLEARDIIAMLPHRYPFVMIDRIVSHVPWKQAVGIKCVTVNEPYFEGHFPGNPIMPGVLIQEAMAQVAATIALKNEPGHQVALLGVDKFRIRKPVVPGDQLRIVADVLKVRGVFWRFKAEATVDGETVANGEFLASITPEAITEGKS